MPHYPVSKVPSSSVRIPYQTTPAGRPLRVALCYKNFQGRLSGSHIGLGVSALNNQKYLRAKGIYAEVWPVMSAAGLTSLLKSSPGNPPGIQPVTHVVVSAPWLSGIDFQTLANTFPAVEFACVTHSNVAFLAADTNAFQLVREYGEVQKLTANFHLAVNNDRLASWLRGTYDYDCYHLANLYMLQSSALKNRAPFTGQTVKIGSFGALRILKNTLAASAAALQLAKQQRLNLEFYVNNNRLDGNGSVIINLRQQFANLRWAKLMEVPWETWPQFSDTVGAMDICMHPSFTETFSVVCADGVSKGVPSVTTDAIEWTPPHWMSRPDDVEDIARIGVNLLYGMAEPLRGIDALTAHNESGFIGWENFFSSTVTHL